MASVTEVYAELYPYIVKTIRDIMGYRTGRDIEVPPGTNIQLLNSSNSLIEEYTFSETGLDDALSSASSGNTIKLPTGTLTLTSNIEIPLGVELTAKSPEDTTITATGDYTKLIQLSTGAKISNITVEYNEQSTSTAVAISSYGATADDRGGLVENVIVNMTSTTSGNFYGIFLEGCNGLVIKNSVVNITRTTTASNHGWGVWVDNYLDNHDFEVDGIEINMTTSVDTDLSGFHSEVYTTASHITARNLDIYLYTSIEFPDLFGIDIPQNTAFYDCNVLVEADDDATAYALNADDYSGSSYTRCTFKVIFSGGDSSGEAVAAFVDVPASFDFCSFEISGDGSYDSDWSYAVFTDATTSITNSIIQPAGSNGWDLWVNSGTVNLTNTTYDVSNSSIYGTIGTLGSSEASPGYYVCQYIDETDSPYSIGGIIEYLFVDTWTSDVTVNLYPYTDGRRIIITNGGDHDVIITSSRGILETAISPIYIHNFLEAIQLMYSSDWDSWLEVPIKKNHVAEIDNTDSPYTAFIQDDYIICDTTSGAITINLPDINGVYGTLITGREITIKNIGGNSVTIDGYSTDTIDGSTTFVLNDNAIVTIIAKSDEWSIIQLSSITDTPDEITATSEGVAASLTTVTTEVTTNGDSDLDNVTLADGVSGQRKEIYCVALGNASDTWKITPATMVQGSLIKFTGGVPGEGCILRYADNEGWVVIGKNGGSFLPLVTINASVGSLTASGQQGAIS